MRINGRARVVDDGNLLAELKEGDKLPKTATVVLVDAVLLHCGKAIDRAACGRRLRSWTRTRCRHFPGWPTPRPDSAPSR